VKRCIKPGVDVAKQAVHEPRVDVAGFGVSLHVHLAFA
jgi:hypothetical protein